MSIDRSKYDEIEAVYPLSPIQKAVLLLSIAPERQKSLFVEQLSCTLTGELNSAVFYQAWQAVVDRHPMFRTAFAWRGLAEPMQAVGRKARLPFEFLDWQDRPSESQEISIRDVARKDLEQGFNLSEAPLLRITLIRTGVEKYWFLWSHHHILLDGSSLSLILSDFWQIYESFMENKDPVLPPARKYQDYIRWLQARDWNGAQSYWRDELKNFKGATRIGLNTTIQRAESAYGDLEIRLPADLSMALRSFSRVQHLTLNTVLQGAWALPLARHSGSDEVIFGATVSGRPSDLIGCSQTVGLFSNTIPIMITVPSTGRVKDWLFNLKRRQVERSRFEYLPLSDIYLASGAPLGKPFFESVFVLQNYAFNARSASGRSGITVSLVRPLIRSIYPLTVMIMPAQQIVVHFSYRQEAFATAFVQRLAEQYIGLLRALIEGADKPISDLAVFTTAEKQENLIVAASQRSDRDDLEQNTAIEALTGLSAVYETVAGIWARLLGCKAVGPDDNLFLVQGSSLTAMRLLGRIREVFQIEVSISSFLEQPTPRGLTTLIERANAIETPLGQQKLKAIPRQERLLTSFSQQRMWFVHEARLDGAFNIPVAIRMFGFLDLEILRSAVASIVSRHEVLRSSFMKEGTDVETIIAPAVSVPLEFTDLSGLEQNQREAQLATLLAKHASRPFDLSEAPLLRLHVIRSGNQEHVLLLTLHHIIADLWSITIFIRDLVAFYEASIRKTKVELPDLPIQYADYAACQRQAYAQGAYSAQREYWVKQLAGAHPLNLPSRIGRSQIHGRFLGATYRFEAPLAEQFHDFIHKEQASLFQAILAVFVGALFHLAPQNDITITTNIHGRNHSWLEDLIGYFVNHLLLRFKLHDDMAFCELLKHTQQICVEAYDNQDFPFEQVPQIMRAADSNWDGNPVQVLFSFQDTPVPPLKMDLLTMLPEPVQLEVSRLELALFGRIHENIFTGYWTYSLGQYDLSMIKKLSSYFVRTLEMASSDSRMTLRHMREAAILKYQPPITGGRCPMQISTSHRRPVLVANEMTRFCLLQNTAFPWVVEAVVEDLDLAEWLRSRTVEIEKMLSKYGSVLFRRFSVQSALDFERAAGALSPNLLKDYGDLPRESVGSKIYGSTVYPKEELILFHNESSHQAQWPLRIWFHCAVAPKERGETPLVDSREVFRRLAPEVVRRFQQKGLIYVRNFVSNLDVSWEKFFGTADKQEVEKRCIEEGTSVQWRPDGSLRTMRKAPAIIVHPCTGETVFFNQILLHHPSMLPREVAQSLRSIFADDALPRNVLYGDGKPIEDELIWHVRDIYSNIAQSFSWHEGDALLVDNMLTAHGRNPFNGPRAIRVAMSDVVKADQFMAAQYPIVT